MQPAESAFFPAHPGKHLGHPSLLNGFVPSFVQRRLPPLRSLLDLAGPFFGPATSSRSPSPVGRLGPPPPPYSTEPPSEDDDMEPDFASAPSSRPSTSDSVAARPFPSTSPASPPTAMSHSADSVVRYKFANHGLLLIAQSAQEFHSNMQTTDEYTRRLYVDGVVYLLRGLPNQLSEDETTTLHAALPETLKAEAALSRDDTPDSATNHIEDSRGRRRRRRQQQRGPQRPQPPLLRRLVSVVVFWAFLTLATVLPYAKLFAQQAYAFERRHKLGELCLT